MLNKFNRLMLLGALIILCACQQIKQQREIYLRNRAKDYVKSSVIPPLKVPTELSQIEHSHLYPLPSPLPAAGLQPVPLEPPGFGQLSQTASSQSDL